MVLTGTCKIPDLGPGIQNLLLWNQGELLTPEPLLSLASLYHHHPAAHPLKAWAENLEDDMSTTFSP